MAVKSAKSAVSKLYDDDLFLWSMENARLLRAGRLDEIDAENLSEEIEAMANRDKREALSRLTVLLHHLLKWKYQPEKRSESWRSRVRTQRRELDRLFKESPSLRAVLPSSVAEAYPDAVEDASGETGLPENVFPAKCPFTSDQVLDGRFLPE